MRPSFRLETGADAPGIAALVSAAFQGHPHSDGTEASIVERLRASGALAISLVAESGGALVGHLALSPVALEPAASGWFGLGPVAVRPSCQGQGVGTALVAEGLARLRGLGAAGCVVFGDPAFYGRLGFQAEPRLVYPGAPDGYFMAQAFGGTVPSGTVRYAAAFGGG